MSILTLPAVPVNFDFAADAPKADDCRPTAGPDFIPSVEEEAEAAELLNGDEPVAVHQCNDSLVM
jgi:hypothetical protein